MKVLHLSFSDIFGGAALAAYRIHNSLIMNNINSKMWVNYKGSSDPTVYNSNKNNKTDRLNFFFSKLRNRLVSKTISKLIKNNKEIFHSPAVLPSSWVSHINNSDADLINLHWINNEMLSIKDLSQIKKPLVWTLHDMWSFCGAEHYTNDSRWKEGYKENNRPNYESGFDLNLWTWNRKKKYWQEPIQIISPSSWLAKCAQQSKLMNNWPVSQIAYPIDTEIYKPLEKNTARDKFNLPLDKSLILFGAFTGTKSRRKGFDLLLKCLHILKKNSKAKNLELIVFGQSDLKTLKDINFPIHYVGHLNDDLDLRALYSASDAMIIPSRLDNLPLTGVEAQACGTPVVGFNTGGLEDILEHHTTGYLAEAFNINDLANGIMWVLSNHKNKEIVKSTRERALKKFSPSIIAKQYYSIYEKVLKKK
jgi:glycosyltransferase involved in cell wall biosynthesis